MPRDDTTARGDASKKYKTLFADGAYEEALAIARTVVAIDPSDDDAADMAAACEDLLRGRYLAKLGSVSAVPQASRTPRGSIDLEPKAMFLLTLVDGVSTIEEIVDVSALGELDVLRLITGLVAKGYVTLA